MATLRCLGSSSAGNCFIVECSDEILILDFGVPWTHLMRALRYDISKVVGGLCTHSHLDHSATVPKALKYCIPIYSCKEVADKCEGVVALQPNRRYRIGKFTIQPLTVEHNVENYAYIIVHPEFGKLVFAIDCARFPYKISEVNHWIIEANHDDELIIEHMCNDVFSQSASDNHLSIDQCLDAIDRNFGEHTHTVVLAHLSDGNSDANGFLSRTQKELNFNNVFIADVGLFIDLINRK